MRRNVTKYYLPHSRVINKASYFRSTIFGNRHRNESIDFITPLVQPYDYHQPAVEHAYDVILKRRGGCEIFVRTYCGKTLNDVMAMLNKPDFDNVEILRIIDSETKDILWDKTVSEV